MSENVITENDLKQAEPKKEEITAERLARMLTLEKSANRQRELHRKWYAANKEAIHEAYKNNGTKEKKAEYYQKNKERILEAAKARYATMKAALDEAKKPKTVGNIVAPGILEAFRGRRGEAATSSE